MKLKAAFIGFRHGHIDGLYTRLLHHDKVEIVAACEEFAPAAEEAKNKGITITHTSFAEMLEKVDFDILAIGDYYGIRGARAIAGLEHGKHIITDKPLCTSAKELRTIASLARSKGLCVGEMLDMRSHKNVAAARYAIRDGVIGKIHQIQFSGQHPLSWGTRPGWYFEEGKHGGTINDIAIHGTDLVEYLTGCEIASPIAARTWNAYADQAPDFKDSAQGMFTMENGCGVIFDVSYAAPSGCATPYYWHFSIWGTKGVLDFHYSSNGVTLYAVGSKEGKQIPAAEPEIDYLTTFLDEISGNPHPEFNTEHILSITGKTLALQALADNV